MHITIPGHQDYDGNEIADLLANYGRTMFLKPNTFPAPTSHIIRKIKNCYKLTAITLQYLPLSSEAKYITYKLLESGKFNPDKISKSISKLTHTKIAILIRILSDVNCLNYHMHKIGYSYTSLCEFCEDNNETERDGTAPSETVSRILYRCPKYMNISEQTPTMNDSQMKIWY